MVAYGNIQVHSRGQFAPNADGTGIFIVSIGYCIVDEAALDFETLAAQAGLRMRVGDVTSTSPAIDPSTTFTYPSVNEVHAALSPEARGFAYARNANPTVAAFEQALAKLEGAEDVVAFGSGMAAVQGALLATGLESEDVIVASNDLYGVSRSLLAQLANFGIETHFVDIFDETSVERAISDARARVLFFESVSNPLVRVAEVKGLAAVAKEHRVRTLLDNTFATPYLLRPLALGIDIVMHSATKYIAGHGDVVAGVVASNRSYGNRIRDVRTVHGGILSPFEAWLGLRGIRTLPLRMEKQCSNAREIAEWLIHQPWVRHVYYPGLREHPQHGIAERQFGGRFGAMIAFDLEADQPGTISFIDALDLVTAGTTLGDVESLVLYPRLSSHRTLTPDQLREAGIGESLVRLSVGIESSRDLIADLQGAARRSGVGQMQKAAT